MGVGVVKKGKIYRGWKVVVRWIRERDQQRFRDLCEGLNTSV